MMTKVRVKLVTLIFWMLLFCFYSSGQMSILSNKDYFLQSDTVEINCTSDVQVIPDVLMIETFGHRQNIKCDNETNECTVILDKNFGYYLYAGNFTCSCGLQGRSVLFVYTYEFLPGEYNSRRKDLRIGFTCTVVFINGIQHILYRNKTYLYVTWEPSKPTLSNSSDGSIEVDHHLVIDCTVARSHPAPRIEWFLGGHNITDHGMFTSISSELQDVKYYTSTSRLNLVIGREMRGLPLTCKAANVVVVSGISSTPLTILVKGEPDVPSLFSIVNVTATSIAVQMIPPYDGGYQQNLVVCYRDFSSTYFKESRMINESETTSVQQYTIAGLSAASLYELKAYSENKINNSLYTNSIKVWTLGVEEFYDQESYRKLGKLAGGLSAIIAICLIVIGILVTKIRKLAERIVLSEVSHDAEIHRTPPAYENDLHVISSEESIDEAVRYEDLCGRDDAVRYEDLCGRDELNSYEEIDRG